MCVLVIILFVRVTNMSYYFHFLLDANYHIRYLIEGTVDEVDSAVENTPAPALAPTPAPTAPTATTEISPPHTTAAAAPTLAPPAEKHMSQLQRTRGSESRTRSRTRSRTDSILWDQVLVSLPTVCLLST